MPKIDENNGRQILCLLAALDTVRMFAEPVRDLEEKILTAPLESVERLWDEWIEPNYDFSPDTERLRDGGEAAFRERVAMMRDLQERVKLCHRRLDEIVAREKTAPSV